MSVSVIEKGYLVIGILAKDLAEKQVAEVLAEIGVRTDALKRRAAEVLTPRMFTRACDTADEARKEAESFVMQWPECQAFVVPTVAQYCN